MKFLIFSLIAFFSYSSFSLEVTECLLTSEKLGNKSAINRYLVKNHKALTIASVEVGRINPVSSELEFIILKGFHTPSSVKEYAAGVAESEHVNMKLEGCTSKTFD